MKNSLRMALIISLLKVATPLWLLTCALMTFHAWHEVSELYQEQQTLFAHQLYNTLPMLNGRQGADIPRQGQGDHQAVAAWDTQGKLLLIDNDGLILAARPGYTGFAAVHQRGEEWRVYYLSGPSGSVAVAQELKERWELIRGLLITQGVLWLVLLPVAILALCWAVDRGLRPLANVCEQLEHRALDDATPLSRAVPQELQTLINAMNGLIQRVADTLQRERRFTADAAHELRSPLAAMRVQAEVAQLVDNPAQRDKALQQLMAGVDRTSLLLTQLLTLSKVDAATELQQQPLDWPVLMQALAADLSGLAASHDCQLVLPADAHNIWPLQQGDPTLLLLMLRNLLNNAIRYGGGQIALHADAQQIIISDQGAGLAPELLDKVRERFFRPPGQTENGSGLGLSIVERIASLHGLQLLLRNGEQGGLQAVLQLEPRGA